MPSLLTNKQREKKKQKIYAILTIDGEEIERFELSENTPHEEFIYFPHDDQYNIIEIDGTRIRDKEDNSPDQIRGANRLDSQPGQTSMCLPHGWWLRLSQPSLLLVIMTPLFRYKTM